MNSKIKYGQVYEQCMVYAQSTYVLLRKLEAFGTVQLASGRKNVPT
jgi:hypothetical protein